MTFLDHSDHDDLPAEGLVVWALAWCALAVFGLMLAGFITMSYLYPETYGPAKLVLNGRLASFATLFLITSGWFAAEAARSKTNPLRKGCLLAASVVALIFAAFRFSAYQREFEYLSDPVMKPFFETYFLITGFHLAIVGLLAVLTILSALKRSPDTHAAAILWNVTAVIWLVIFPIIYLV